MTYSIVGRDPETGEYGLASTTVSFGVGGLIPFFTKAGAMVVSQAYALPALGSVIVKSLDSGGSLEEAIEAARASDRDFEYRQVAILTRNGDIAVHSGSSCRPWTGHLRGNECLAFGNVLAGEVVISAMAEAFETAESVPLTERLILALEAGRDAGGQAARGRHLRERSAFVLVKKSLHNRVVDLRVDVSAHAVEDIRHAMSAVSISEPYVRLRAQDPANCPSVVDFEQSLELPDWYPGALDPRG